MMCVSVASMPKGEEGSVGWQAIRMATPNAQRRCCRIAVLEVFTSIVGLGGFERGDGMDAEDTRKESTNYTTSPFVPDGFFEMVAQGTVWPVEDWFLDGGNCPFTEPNIRPL